VDGLHISGLVQRPATLSFENLATAAGQVPDVSALIPGRKGRGVRLAALLAQVEVRPEARYLILESTDGFSASVPLEAVDGQGLVVYADAGAPLTERDGGPVRFYIIDVVACGIADVDRCANVKHLGRIHLSRNPGNDTRPATARAHEALHERERRVDAGPVGR
jgi:DMSO/TMAO reductase YedYZ molybdopterin-dependent catalytic subunit